MMYHTHEGNKINRGTTTAPAILPPLSLPFDPLDPLALGSLVAKMPGSVLGFPIATQAIVKRTTLSI
jgi:hypothetical protein